MEREIGSRGMKKGGGGGGVDLKIIIIIIKQNQKVKLIIIIMCKQILGSTIILGSKVLFLVIEFFLKEF